MDLTHTDGGKTCRFDCCRQGGFRRFQRKIVAIGSSLKTAGLAHKGTGDHPPNAVLAHKQPPGDPAIFVQLRRGNDILMGGDLKHRIGRCVDDQIPAAHMLRAILLNDRRAGPGGICQHAPACFPAERL